MRKFETLFVILWHLKYCNFERCCSNEVIKLLPLSISLVFGSVVYVIAFRIEKGFWVHFSWYIFLLLKTSLHLLYDNLGKSKVWVSLLLNLILYWRLLVTLLTPHEYKFAFFVTLTRWYGHYDIIPFFQTSTQNFDCLFQNFEGMTCI